MEGWPVINVIKVKRLAGGKDGRVFREVAVMGIVQAICKYNVSSSNRESCRLHKHTVNELAG